MSQRIKVIRETESYQFEVAINENLKEGWTVLSTHAHVRGQYNESTAYVAFLSWVTNERR